MEQVKWICLKNPFPDGGFGRKRFICMELNIPNQGDWMAEVVSVAGSVAPQLNLGQANTSGLRSMNTVEIDNLSGMIAEMACFRILRWLYGDDRIIKPPLEKSADQIDIRLFNGKTIEVRSSCVRNGIPFAVFAMDKRNPSEQYFDVIGPYSNGYKYREHWKDYYMRVLYWCDKKDFLSLLEKPVLQLYITGGATRQMMNDESRCQDKHMRPADGQVAVESDYRVMPLGKSLDAREFFHLLERENGLERLHA